MSGNELATKRERIDSLKGILEKAKPTIQAMLPKHLSPDRLLKLSVMAANDQPLLLKADPMSVVKCAIVAAQLGLEPNTPLGEAWILPYTLNKKNQQGEWVKVVTAQFIPGYQGLIKLARNSGLIDTIEARVVYEKDVFELEFGLDQKLRHVPYLDGDPGAIRFAYAFARLTSGSFLVEPLSRRDFEKIKASSQSASSKFSPYVNWEDEMWRKAALKRLCKYLPKSQEMARAIALDNAAESGAVQLIELEQGAVPVDENLLPQAETAGEEVQEPKDEEVNKEKPSVQNVMRPYEKATGRLAEKIKQNKEQGSLNIQGAEGV